MKLSHLLGITLIFYLLKNKISVAGEEHEKNSPFYRFVHLFSSEESDSIRSESFEKMLNTLGERIPKIKNCFATDKLSSIYVTGSEIREEGFTNISKALVNVINAGKCEDGGLRSLGSAEEEAIELQAERVIGSLKDLDYKESNSSKVCFNAFTLANLNDKSQFATSTLWHLHEGHCVLPEKDFFLSEYKELFESEDGAYTTAAFAKVLNRLGIGQETGDSSDHEDHGDHEGHADDEENGDHEHENDGDEDQSHDGDGDHDHDDEDHSDHESHDDDGDHDHEDEDHDDHESHDDDDAEGEEHGDHGHEADGGDEDHGDDDGGDHGHEGDEHGDEEDHEDHDHGNEKGHSNDTNIDDHGDHEEGQTDGDKNNDDHPTSASETSDDNEDHKTSDVESDGHDHDHDHDHDHSHNGKKRRKRASHDHDHDHESEAHQEGESSRCFSSEQFFDIFEVSGTITEEKILEMCPAFIQQITSGDCAQSGEHDHGEDGGSSGYTQAMVYGYGTASVAIISLLALLGLALFPAMTSKTYKYTMQIFIGLGIGTMAGDSLLHIIPHVLGLHVHDDHDHAEGEEEDMTFVWKLSVVLGGMYIFFLLENGLRLWKRLRVETKAEADETAPEGNHNTAHYHDVEVITSFSSVDNSSKSSKKARGSTVSETVSQDDILPRDNIVCFSFTSTLITVFIGDVLHNFADGLAIGVSFTTSWTTGVGTSLAILCHELPHELADFAIYMNNGASKWQAIGFNVVAACCAFLGLYTGIGIGQHEDLRAWLMAAIAGMFLYIALVQVLNEMTREQAPSPVLQFVVQNLGLLVGWALMLLIALYEDAIQGSISA